MSDNLPPLPDWLQLTNDEVRSRVRAYGQQCRQQALEDAAQAMLAYGQQCRQQALEEAALACRYLRGFPYKQCDFFESAVLALRDKP